MRYCEADGFNYCDTHTSETVVWAAIPSLPSRYVGLEYSTLASTT